MRGRHAGLVALAVAAALAAPAGARAQPRAVTPDPAKSFGTVVQGTRPDHAFVLRNEGTDPLRIRGAHLTPSLTLARVGAVVPPGAEVRLAVALDTAGLLGDYEGRILVATDDPARPEVTFTLAARIVGLVELDPLPAFFVAAQRGRPAEASLEIVNHDREPLEILRVEHPTDRFTTRLETLEPGQRYRLVLRLDATGPGGKRTDPILLHTSSAARPVLRVPAHTYVKEAVYAFPDAIDFGTLQLPELRDTPGLAERVAQTLMVYEPGSRNFDASFTTDVPGLRITAERGPDGDRWQATLTLDPSKLATGPVRGSVIITTNDPKVPVLRVPVTGEFR